nr:ferrochelatase [Xylella fastidiosa subsp. sandyi]
MAHMNHTSDTALLIVNLGTPEVPTAAAVRRYLGEFLSDRRVVSIPPLFWKPLLHMVILPIRGPRSASKYAKVWLQEGSPLSVYTRRIAEGLTQHLPDWRVAWAMRYGAPALTKALDALQAQQVRRIVILPLYPQYSTTTTASVQDVVEAWCKRTPQVQVECIQDYAEDPAWVAAVAASIRRHWQAHGRSEKLMFSFHGLPQRVANNGDPYPQRCQVSASLIAAALNLNESEWVLGYQSRFGAERWLQPYAEPTLWALAESGIRRFDLVCPGFSVDCLETLEEVALGFSETLAARGATMRYIPCLNDDPAHVQALAGLAQRALL